MPASVRSRPPCRSEPAFRDSSPPDPGSDGFRYHRLMARCTAPVRGHRTASGAADCPVHGGRYGSYRSYGSYSSPSSNASAYQSQGSGRGTGTGGGSVGGSTRPRWSPSSSSVTYTPDQVRALTPYRRMVESRGQQPELRDLFLCHAWDDRRGAATSLNDLLEAEGVSVWFSEKDILLGQPFMREIDRGLAKFVCGPGPHHPCAARNASITGGSLTRSSRSFWHATS